MKKSEDFPFPGLYGEVVTEDAYGLRSIDFDVDVFFDLGANVGICANFARHLFPQAKIICVEPDDENFEQLVENTDGLGNIQLIHAAIGDPERVCYWNPEAINGAHKAYLQTGLGQPFGALEAHPKFEQHHSTVALWLETVIAAYWHPSRRCILKIDIEGGENAIWTHMPSVNCFRFMDFITMELHNAASDAQQLAIVNQNRQRVLDDLKETHETEQTHIYFKARKKNAINSYQI